MPSSTGALSRALALPAQAHQLRTARPDAVQHLDEAYAALYKSAQVLPAKLLHSIAAIVARRQGSAQLTRHHSALGDPEFLGEELPRNLKLRAIIEHVDLITTSPALVTREDQLTLELAGVTPDEIVLISQVVAFTSTAVRVHHAFSLLVGTVPDQVPALARPTVARGRDLVHPTHTARGSRIPAGFTRDVLAWEPWVPAPSEAELSEVQRESFAAKTSTNSEYFRLLARAPEVLRARSALDNAVFLGRDGLTRGERELAAAVTSKVNDCVYCASVHARKAEFQTKRTAEIDRLLAVTLPRDGDWLPGEIHPLADGQEPRWAALIRFSAGLAELVPSADLNSVSDLEVQGFSTAEIADAALATAFFSWANRLMLSLGEPAVPGTATHEADEPQSLAYAAR